MGPIRPKKDPDTPDRPAGPPWIGLKTVSSPLAKISGRNRGVRSLGWELGTLPIYPNLSRIRPSSAVHRKFIAPLKVIAEWGPLDTNRLGTPF
jgi:hypothetical protein